MLHFTRRIRLIQRRQVFGRPPLLAALALAAACGVSDSVAVEFAVCEQAVGPDCVVGSLAIVISGLPESVDAEVTVTGPGEFSLSLRETQVLEDLLPGEYTITAGTVSGDTSTYDPGEASQVVMVSESQTAEVDVQYGVNEQAEPGS